MESVSEGTKEKKVALVTGAARGLGLLTARKLATKGFRVVLTARDMKAGQAALTEIRKAVPRARYLDIETE